MQASARLLHPLASRIIPTSLAAEMVFTEDSARRVEGVPVDTGEEIARAYLQYVRGCDFTACNVPTSGSQGELDVIGIDLKSKMVYVCEVAIHLPTGLLYTSRDGKPNNVDKLVAKFERGIDHVRTAFPEHSLTAMLWSPILPLAFLMLQTPSNLIPLLPLFQKSAKRHPGRPSFGGPSIAKELLSTFPKARLDYRGQGGGEGRDGWSDALRHLRRYGTPSASEAIESDSVNIKAPLQEDVAVAEVV